MAKISFTKLGLKKNTNIITLTWNDQIIEIKEYLPINDKIALIEHIVNWSLDDNNFANPIRVTINKVLEFTFAYTNINFTEKQKEDRLALYDLLVSSGLWSVIQESIPEMEQFIINQTVQDVITEIYKYKDSALGVLQAISEDYQNLNLDLDALHQKMNNKEDIKMLKTVIDKMG